MIGSKTDLKDDRIALWKSSRLVTTERSNLRRTASALPVGVSTSLFRLPSLANTTPRYLNFSTCCNLLPLTCSVWAYGFWWERTHRMVLLSRYTFAKIKFKFLPEVMFTCCFRDVAVNCLRQTWEVFYARF